jgi:DNA (cytosine-5)-methyltransferase 1
VARQVKLGSLCSGYGGLDLAIESLFEVELAWYAEYDKNPAKIMETNYPNVKNLKDLTKINWSEIEPVDILSAGYPCQPFSQAGQRKGTNDPRHLWPYIFEAVGTIRPKLVILENVRGHLSLGFDAVLKDLASIGYAAEWQIVRASEVGAPHQRARLFIIAYPEGSRRRTQQDSDGTSISPKENGLGVVTKSNPCTIANTKSVRARLQQVGNETQKSKLRNDNSIITNTDSATRQQSQRANRTIRSERKTEFDGTNRKVAWGCYQEAITNWERLTRISPDPIKNDRLEPKFVEWLMGLPEGWVTDVDISDNAKLKALGNGVVPQQAAYAINMLINER